MCRSCSLGNYFYRMYTSLCQSYDEVCCETIVTEKAEQATAKVDSQGCGYQNLIGLGPRITGSSENAHFGEFPWSVIISFKETKNKGKSIYTCGGSLIHAQAVLTAAHCVHGKPNGDWIIRAGEWNTRAMDEPLAHQDRMVNEIVIHPLYHSGSLRNDVALMLLVEPFEIAENVGIICLPSSTTMQLDNLRCLASGWGKDAFKKGRYSSVLKKIELPIVPRERCLELLRSTRLGQFYHLHRSFICAGGENKKDTCKGDGGSPLICPIPGYGGRFQQMGIVSWGIGCGENNTPGVYVNVPLYLGWINRELLNRNFDIGSYNI